MSDESLAARADSIDTARWFRRPEIYVVVLQFWAFAAYTLAGPLPYLLAGRQYGASGPDWLLAFPLWPLVIPGAWMVLLEGASGAVFAIIGIAALPAALRLRSRSVTAWLIVGTLLNLAVIVFAESPLGADLRTWFID
jgi:hypothetical protein